MVEQLKTSLASTASRTRFKVDGMDCAGRAAKIDTAVRRLPGVTGLEVSLMSGVMTVQHGSNDDLGAVKKTVTALGYTVAPLRDASKMTAKPKGQGRVIRSLPVPGGIAARDG